MIRQIDFAILDWIQSHLKCGFFDHVLTFITYLGSFGIIWILAALLFLFFKKYRRCGITMGAGMLSGLLIGNLLLKNLVRRPRPCWGDSAVELLIRMPSDFSFPSGHTLAGFIAATVIFRRNRKMGIAAYFVAFLIAFSRLYLYVHFPSDVLGGALLGIAIGLLASILSDRIAEKNRAREEA